MSLLKVKMKLNRLTKEVQYIVSNAIIYSSARDKWMLRIPREILRVAKMSVGDRIDVKIDQRSLILRRLPIGRMKRSIIRAKRKSSARNER